MEILLLAFFFCLFWLILPERKTTVVHVNEQNSIANNPMITSEDLLGCSKKDRDSVNEILDKLEKEKSYYYEILLISRFARFAASNPENMLVKTMYEAMKEHHNKLASEVEIKTNENGNYDMPNRPRVIIDTNQEERKQ